MGRLGLQIPMGSQQALNAFFAENGPWLLQELDARIREYSQRRVSLTQAMRGLTGSGIPALSAGNPGTPPIPAIGKRKKPMSDAHRAALKAAALRRKGMPTGTPATTTATGRGKTKAAVMATGG